MIAGYIGNFALFLLNILAILYCLIFFIVTPKKSQEIYKKFYNFAKINSFAIFILILIAKLSLIYSYIISDYSILNVYQNSHDLKPLIYKISGSWGNHEGSMLLLILILTFYSILYLYFNKNTSLKEKITILLFQNLIIAAFSSYTYFTSNPFVRIFPPPLSGVGLNPILQDIGLALHPPMLYIGYVGFSLVFSVTCANLYLKTIDNNYVKTIKYWLYFSTSFLTVGITLGSWWAYRELGWGGYWFWDPVENISLMPWLAAITLIHSVKLFERNNNFKHFTVILAILSFVLCLIGIFLTRSGILSSVHSFSVDSKRGFFILFIITLIGIVGFLLYGKFANNIKTQDKKNKKNLNYDNFIYINNYILIIFLFVIFLGTIYPIISSNLFDISISIGANYYNKILSYLIIPFLIALALYHIKKNQKKILFLLYPLLILAICSLSFLKYDIKTSALISISLTSFLLILFDSFKVKNKIFKIKNSDIAHLGFVISVIGVIASSVFYTEKELNIKQGQKFNFLDYQVEFSNISYDHGSNYIYREGNFEFRKNDKIFNLKPRLNYYPISDKTTNEVAIKRSFLGDIYIAIGQKDENDSYGVRIYFKPLIYLIWLGAFMIGISILIKFIKLKAKKQNLP